MTSPKDRKLLALVAPPAPSAPTPWVRTVLGDTGYRANPDAFAMQMEVFDRMRETARGSRQSKEASHEHT